MTVGRLPGVGELFGDLVAGGLVRAGVRGVFVRGEVPPGGLVWAANHHSWWDGFAPGLALRRLGRRPGVVVERSSLDRFPLLRRLGAVGTDEIRRAVEHARREPLVVFPEGELLPPDRLGPLRPGAAWIADRAGVPLLPVAVRAAVRGHAAPEVLVDVGAALPPGATTPELADRLGALLAALDALVASAPAEEPLPGFREVVRGRRDWNERFSR